MSWPGDLCHKGQTKEQGAASVNGDGQEVSGQMFSRFVNDASPGHTGSDNPSEGQGQASGQGHWQPLLLIVPLRLGLTDINPIYFEALKVRWGDQQGCAPECLGRSARLCPRMFGEISKVVPQNVWGDQQGCAPECLGRSARLCPRMFGEISKVVPQNVWGDQQGCVPQNVWGDQQGCAPECLGKSASLCPRVFNSNNNDGIERRKSRFLQSPRWATNCLQHVHLSGQGKIVCKSSATHWVLVTCNMSCASWYKGTAQLLSLTELKLHLF